MSWPVRVRAPLPRMPAPVRWATPKSSTLGPPACSTTMFAGLRSRWITPCWCGVLHGVAGVRHQLEAGARVQGMTADVLVQRQAADELHREIELPVLGGAGLVDLGDSGVVQPAQDPRFQGEPLAEVGGVEVRAHHLQRDRPPRVVLLGLVDGAHTALADPPDDPVTTEERLHGPPRHRRSRPDVGRRAAQEIGRACARASKWRRSSTAARRWGSPAHCSSSNVPRSTGFSSAACWNSASTASGDGSGMVLPFPG